MTLSDDLNDFDEFESLQSEIIAFSSPGIRPGLRRILRLLFLLGDPQYDIPAIQVLGTNGKGSAAASMEAMLRPRLKTALYTSPHLVSPQERLRIDGRYLSICDWREAWSAVKKMAESDAELSSDKPSFFENFTAMCMLMTRNARADAAILEAGMGGRYDATSVCRPIAVMISPIGMDHTQYLGSTLAEIAGEKFAAIRCGTDAFYAGDDAELSRIFLEYCGKIGVLPRLLDGMALPENVRCTLGGTRFSYAAKKQVGGVSGITELETPLLGPHQAHNAARAISVLLSLKEKYGMFSFLTPDSIRDSLILADWPGRLELLHTPDGPVIIDGAHNGHAMRALVSAINSITDGREKIKISSVVLAVMGDKDIPEILSELKELSCPVYCAGLPTERAASPDQLAELSRLHGIDAAGYYENPDDALSAALRRACGDGFVLCCGSLHLAGRVRGALKYSR